MYDKLNNYIGEMITYKQMCEILGLKYYTGGKAKKLQIEDIFRYYDIEKIKTKYMIHDKYETPYAKEDKRKSSELKKHYDKYVVDKNQDNDIGVYCIATHDSIYIGSTIDSFRRRFLCHKNNRWSQKHTKKMLDNGALFQILWASDVEDEYIIRQVEQMYIDYFMASPDWKLMNRYEETVCLSEKKKKYKNKTIKVDERQYELALEILKQNGIMIGGDCNE